jgi:long-subunit acyl-CoA synthetase (AMP-forming)
VDDVIILATGEKIVPGPTEGTLLAHPAVQGVIMFGRERNQAGLLVEPAEHRVFDPADENALIAFRNEIWPAVEEANRTAPAFGRVFKEMILATKPDKALPRVGKGSVSRKGALLLYDEEIHVLLVQSFP